MAFSLEELQRQFLAVQESTPVQALSESACVDIVMKLMKRKHFSLSTTLNGKEFVTPEYLTQEIRSYLVQHNGRVNVVEMATSLGMNPDTVTSKTEELVRKSKHLQLIGVDLISSFYFNTIAQEIAELLEERGQLGLGELCQKYSLPADVLRHEIQTRHGTSIQGELRENNTLTTPDFFRRVECVVRGSCLAACHPLSLHTLADLFNLPSDSVCTAATDLLRRGEISGKISSGIFTPSRYLDHQTDKISSFFQLNLYVPYSLVKECGVSDALRYLKKEAPEGIALHTVYVHPQLFAPLEATIQEAMSTSSWADVSSFLIAGFSPEDTQMFLNLAVQLSMRKSNEKPFSSSSLSSSSSPFLSSSSFPVVVSADEGLVLTYAFLNEVLSLLQPLLLKRAIEKSSDRLASSPGVSSSKKKESEASQEKLKKKGGEEEDEEEEEREEVPRSKRRSQQHASSSSPSSTHHPAGRSEDEKSDNEVDEEEEKAGGGGITAKKNSRRSAGGGGGKGRRGKGSGGGNSDKKKKSSSSSSRPTGVSTSKEREGRLTYEEVADMIAQDSHFTGGGEAEERRKGEDGVDDLKSLWTSLPLHVQEYLWKAIEDEVNSRYEKCIGEARTSLRDQNRQKIEKKTQDLQTAYEDICLSVKALEVLEIGEDTKHPLLVHFYKTRVGSFVDSLVYAAYTEATAEEVEVTPQNRRCLLEKVKKLGVSPVSDLSKASEMLSKRDAFLSLPDILHAAGEDVHLLFRKPDKRRIKHLLLTKKIEAQSTLNACNPTDPSAVLHAALSLLLTQYLSTFQAYFDFPRDTWAISAVVGLLLSHEKKSKKKTQKSEDQDESEDVTKQENGEIQKHQKEKKTDAKASSSSSSPTLFSVEDISPLFEALKSYDEQRERNEGEEKLKKSGVEKEERTFSSSSEDSHDLKRHLEVQASRLLQLFKEKPFAK